MTHELALPTLGLPIVCNSLCSPFFPSAPFLLFFHPSFCLLYFRWRLFCQWRTGSEKHRTTLPRSKQRPSCMHFLRRYSLPLYDIIYDYRSIIVCWEGGICVFIFIIIIKILVLYLFLSPHLFSLFVAISSILSLDYLHPVHYRSFFQANLA